MFIQRDYKSLFFYKSYSIFDATLRYNNPEKI